MLAVKTSPERIYGWLNSQLSIARHYGGCSLNGFDYVIENPEDPESPLVRKDVLRREVCAKKAARREQRRLDMAKAKAEQGALL